VRMPAGLASTMESLKSTPSIRGLHSSTFQLNVSAFLCDWGCVKGISGGISRGVMVC
jgi:hypothetical protein